MFASGFPSDQRPATTSALSRLKTGSQRPPEYAGQSARKCGFLIAYQHGTQEICTLFCVQGFIYSNLFHLAVHLSEICLPGSSSRCSPHVCFTSGCKTVEVTRSQNVRCALACDRFSAAGTKIFVAFDSATLRKKPRCLESECLNSTHVNFLCLILQKYSMRGCYEMPIWSTFEKHEAARFPLTPIQMTFPTPSMKQTRLTPLYLLFYFGIL